MSENSEEGGFFIFFCSTWCCSQLFYISSGDLIDTVKTAAEGVRNQSSSVATWMRNTVSPTLRTILPASPGPPPGEPQPSTSAAQWAGRPVRNKVTWLTWLDIVRTIVLFFFSFKNLISHGKYIMLGFVFTDGWEELSGWDVCCALDHFDMENIQIRYSTEGFCTVG